MKQKHFKISDSTLFVYKSKKASKEKIETDPTTTIYTLTVTGFNNVNRLI